MDFNGDFPGSRVKRLKVDTTSDLSGDVHIGGNLTVDGTADFDIKTVHTIDGTAAAPSHSFTDQKLTGIYRDLDGSVGTSVNGEGKFFVKSIGTQTLGSSIVEGPIAGNYFTFTGDEYDNSTIVYNPDVVSVDVKVHGDFSMQLRSKGFDTINGTFADTCQTTTLFATTCSVQTEVHTPLLTATTASCTSVSTSTLTASSQPLVRYNAAGSQSISGSGVFQALTNWNTSPMIATGTVSERPSYNPVGGLFTCNSTGYYIVSYVVPWAVASGVRMSSITPSTVLTTGTYGYSSKTASTLGGFPSTTEGMGFFKWNQGETLVLSVAQAGAGGGGTTTVQDAPATGAFQYINIQKLY